MATKQPTEQRISKDARLNLRLTPQQERLIREAALASGRSVSDFVLGTTTVEAERVLADRRSFLLDGDQWRRFNELLDASFEADERLVTLMTVPVVIDLIDQ